MGSCFLLSGKPWRTRLLEYPYGPTERKPKGKFLPKYGIGKRRTGANLETTRSSGIDWPWTAKLDHCPFVHRIRPTPNAILGLELDLILQFALYQSLPQLVEFVSALFQGANHHTIGRIVGFKFYQRQ